jgi:biotin carboxylase
MLQHRLFETGYRIIIVWSDRSQPSSREKHFKRSGHPKEDFEAVIVHEVGNLAGTVAKILDVTHDITAVMCGSEYGVILEDAVADGLNEALKTNRFRSSGLPNSMLKVDKHLQANTIRQAGLDAVREKLARCEDDVRQFLEEQSNGTDELKVVLKPQTGAGSVGVTFCDSKEAVWTTYHTILAGEHKAHCGDKYRHYTHAGVLMQEYLAGTEYIVNCVVRDGVIKTTAMFKYDKRPYNGGSFVCFSK